MLDLLRNPCSTLPRIPAPPSRIGPASTRNAGRRASPGIRARLSPESAHVERGWMMPPVLWGEHTWPDRRAAGAGASPARRFSLPTPSGGAGDSRRKRATLRPYPLDPIGSRESRDHGDGIGEVAAGHRPSLVNTLSCRSVAPTRGSRTSVGPSLGFSTTTTSVSSRAGPPRFPSHASTAAPPS